MKSLRIIVLAAFAIAATAMPPMAAGYDINRAKPMSFAALNVCNTPTYAAYYSDTQLIHEPDSGLLLSVVSEFKSPQRFIYIESAFLDSISHPPNLPVII
ncbi:MAG: hypothetical protein L7F77_00545 [Candidatus Magnetominusculus sp. LBB02]|nr:hypothetical protein [Candidatus Magnetominusculus sp. LBB02]